MPQAQIQLISFDLDDTLFDNGPVIKKAFQALYDYLCTEYPLLKSRMNLKEFIAHAHQHRSKHPNIVDFTVLRHLQIKDVLQSAGYSNIDSKPAYEVFLAARQKVSLYSAVRPLFELLKQDYDLVSITNGNADPDRIGLHGYFHDSFNPGRCGFAKPDPRFYQDVCQRLNINPENMLHIGDGLENDFRAARKAGCHALWLHFQQPTQNVSPSLEDLSSLLKLLQTTTVEQLIN